MVYPTLTVLPVMRAQGGGRIVNITSIAGKVSLPHLLPYNCAKFAALAFSQGLRAELGRVGITVVTVVLHGIFPGLTTEALGLVNALLLPSPEGDGQNAVRGHEAVPDERSPVLRTLTKLGRAAADRFGQHPGPRVPVACPAGRRRAAVR
ncbi:MAG: SDR family NAD(P)-dependent oxidoreductase [Candidatus Rokubacteria bacterium]|nr:SDR family NAD(P)-dependent oxidoreductase [Candidatus Rokubacteria bacterium]